MEFLRLVKRHLNRECKPWLLYDMHFAHRARIVQAYIEEHFRPLMVPKRRGAIICVVLFKLLYQSRPEGTMRQVNRAKVTFGGDEPIGLSELFRGFHVPVARSQLLPAQHWLRGYRHEIVILVECPEHVHTEVRLP